MNVYTSAMSPSELEEQIYQDPFIPLRLTLASGDQIIIEDSRRVLMVGLAIYYSITDDPESRIGKRVKIISVPNIVLAEPVTH